MLHYHNWSPRIVDGKPAFVRDPYGFVYKSSAHKDPSRTQGSMLRQCFDEDCTIRSRSAESVETPEPAVA